MASIAKPSFLLLAGPNGSGKSTLSAALIATLFEHTAIFDPDASATGNPIADARTSIRAVEAALSKRASLVVETTLAGTRGIRLLNAAKALDYRVALFFICTASVEINLRRIAERVAAGGHDVPADDVRRRYGRSLARLCNAMRASDEFTLLDNSTENGPEVVAHGTCGAVIHHAKHVPAWAREVIED